jgi:hypothetical protein
MLVTYCVASNVWIYSIVQVPKFDEPLGELTCYRCTASFMTTSLLISNIWIISPSYLTVKFLLSRSVTSHSLLSFGSVLCMLSTLRGDFQGFQNRTPSGAELKDYSMSQRMLLLIAELCRFSKENALPRLSYIFYLSSTTYLTSDKVQWKL